MIQGRARKALVLALLASAAVPGAALAQSQSSQAGVAAELVVTAQKRTEALQQVPVSVAAVPGRVLEQMQATDMQDWSGFVAGLTVGDNGAPGEANLAID